MGRREHRTVEARRAFPAGFTLIELLVVIALIGILIGLSVGGLDLMKARATFASAAGDMVGALRRVQADAWGNGVYSAFVVDTTNRQWWALENVEDNFTVDSTVIPSFDPSNPTNGGTRKLIASGTLPTGMGFGPYGAAFPAPFSTVSTAKGCSFCLTSNNRGAMIFRPGEPVDFSLSSTDMGQQFTLTGNMAANGSASTTHRTLGVVVVARTGLVETFEP